jgi:hypothetical protein
MQVVAHENGQEALELRTLGSRFVTRCFTCAKYAVSGFFCARGKENWGVRLCSVCWNTHMDHPRPIKAVFWGLVYFSVVVGDALRLITMGSIIHTARKTLIRVS